MTFRGVFQIFSSTKNSLVVNNAIYQVIKKQYLATTKAFRHTYMPK